jgi:hypothetical protein
MHCAPTKVLHHVLLIVLGTLSITGYVERVCADVLGYLKLLSC